jgi:hypothetical protein
MALSGGKIKGTKLTFDPDFRFLLTLDPAFEEWRKLAADWWQADRQLKSAHQTGICAFFITYLHGQELNKLPTWLLEKGKSLPDLWKTLGLDSVGVQFAKRQYNTVSDFLGSVLREKFSQADTDGHLVIHSHLHNPFPRKSQKNSGKTNDLNFGHILLLDSRLLAWQQYASEYIQTLRFQQGMRRNAVDAFLTRYLFEQNLPLNPLEFLQRTTPKPSFLDVLMATKWKYRSDKKGSGKKTKTTDIKINTYVADFIDWVLLEKLAVESDFGERMVPHEYHNPIERLSRSGIITPNETVKNALPMLYIRMLREMLAEGKTFRDWTWAHSAIAEMAGGGDWFIVDPSKVNYNDPDCVWRKRKTSKKEREKYNLPETVTELWSPVRAVALYTKLELPLRSHQVRFLDSGEGDTWRYVWDTLGGRFELNDTLFTSGSEARPCQRGVFYREANAKGSGFFINTNKTSDINKPEDDKGYVIPWTHIILLYWLEKLRTWQERYNPVEAAMPWTELGSKHFSVRPSIAILAERSPAFFLFRDPVNTGMDKGKPLAQGGMDLLWFKLLTRLEQRLIANEAKDASGNPVSLVNPDGRGTHFPLHSLRVSLITGLIMDGGLPIEVVSKLIVGHHGLIQTIYYTKIGIDHMNKLMAEAEQKMNESEAKSYKIFLMKHARDEINQRFASVSEDGFTAAMNQKSEVGFVFDDKGVCPVGCAMCDVGGEKNSESKGRSDYKPVPGYPQERNCIRCRFFLTGPAWLHALNAKFNNIAYQALQAAERYNRFTEQVVALEERRSDCEAKGSLFTESLNLEKISQRLEAETETLDRWISDLQSAQRLINRCIEISKNAPKDGLQLVAAGTLFDIRTALIATESELHPIEVQCRNATVYCEIDARQPAMRRSQLLDTMLATNKKPILFSRLSVEQQLQAGNAMMKLIEGRSGSIEKAVEFVEARGRLVELGIVDDDLIKTLSSCDTTHGLPLSQIIRELNHSNILTPIQNKEFDDES